MPEQSWWNNVHLYGPTSQKGMAFLNNSTVSVMPTQYGNKPATLHEPHFAAQMLRTILQQMVTHAKNASGKSFLTSGQKATLKSYDAAINERCELIRTELASALEEIKTRKAKDPMLRINRVLEHIQMVQNQATTQMMRIDGINKPTPKSADELHQLEQLFEYAQCLPTVPDVPKTSAENTLRAIVALLRHHNWPDTKGLTQNPPKESDGQTEESGDVVVDLSHVAAAVGAPVPVGAAPGYDAGDAGDGEDEYDPDDE